MTFQTGQTKWNGGSIILFIFILKMKNTKVLNFFFPIFFINLWYDKWLLEGTISQLKEVIAFIIKKKNVLKLMGFNYMQANTTHIYIFSQYNQH